jgi:hypothetical protein
LISWASHQGHVANEYLYDHQLCIYPS